MTPVANDPFYQKAMVFDNQGRLAEAIEFYEKSAKLKKSYQPYLKLALCNQELEYFNRAIHYCELFLQNCELKDPNIGLVKSLKKSLEKEYYIILNSDAENNRPIVQKDDPVLKEKLDKALIANKQLRSVILALKKRKMPTETGSVTLSKDPKATVKETETKPATETIPKNVKYYTVVSGDNLSKISSKMYKTSKHWKKILDANKKTLPDASKLKIGQKLIIPEL